MLCTTSPRQLEQKGMMERFKVPTKRMPMGLVEYIANFFVAENMQQVNNHVYFVADPCFTK